MTEQLHGRWKNRVIPIVLFLIFLLPVLGSWIMAFYTDFMRDKSGTLQHGILIDPPQMLENVKLADSAQGEQTWLHGRWTMLAVTQGECEKNCQENLYRMRQIRLAMGKEMHRIQRVILLQDMNLQNSIGDILKNYPGQLVLSQDDIDDAFKSYIFSQNKINNHAIFLIDPLGYLMMCYPPDTDPAGIIKDMKRLLKISRIG